MAEAGQIARGTVVRILAYGALVRLDDGCLGLVHISEIDSRYVKEVGEYLGENVRVVVKVLQEKEGGRWEFSIKAAKGALPPEGEPIAADFDEETPDDTPMQSSAHFGATARLVSPAHGQNHGSSPHLSRAALDEKLREFMADSTERLNDVRRHNEHKLGHKRR